jgi:hypothetical protein
MNPIRSIVFLFAFCIAASAIAQESAIGEWRAHLPYRKCTALAEAGNLIYCATPFALFNLNRDDNSVNRLSKVNGLSDVEISTIKYSETYKMLLVAYTNANIDLITENGIVNISDIKRKNIFGKKSINRIMFLNQYAYLSCGFGIVVLDLAREEIFDTYFIGPLGSSLEVNDVAFDGSRFYAATVSGIYSAFASGYNLADYSSWQKDTTLHQPSANYSHFTLYGGNKITVLANPAYGDDTLFINHDTAWHIMLPGIVDDYKSLNVSQSHLLICSNSNLEIFNDTLGSVWNVYDYNPGSPAPMGAFEDNDGAYWIADNYSGLVKNKGWSNEFFKPNGPGSHQVFSLTASGSDIWVAPGSFSSSMGNTYTAVGPFSFINETWYTLKDYNPRMDSLWDILYFAVDPSNKQRVFFSTWGHGLVEMQNGIVVADYSYGNSGLQKPYDFFNWVGIGGLAFDPDGNLWVVNSDCNQLLKVLKPDGTWKSLNVSSVASQPKATRIMIDAFNQKWVMLFGSGGIIVYDDNGTLENTSDDHMIKLSTSLGGGNLPSGSVLAFAEDLDGEIWVGTDKGLAVFYNPGNIFTGDNFDAQVITIEQDSTAQHLLEFETVTAIAVDGANKKWVGTMNAGIFLFSDDGQKEIHHFTAENSPLLSNTITDIAIDGNSGEVFFGTDKGICSYKGFATTGQEKYQGVYAYPNPVPPDFTGYIGIKGLTRNSWIKITDISGTLIYETRSEGGQAVWNGCNFNGDKAKSGVYPVICISEDGTEKIITKILIVN